MNDIYRVGLGQGTRDSLATKSSCNVGYEGLGAVIDSHSCVPMLNSLI
jgi:hypothetical protein